MKSPLVIALATTALAACSALSPGHRHPQGPPVAVVPPPAQVEDVPVGPPPPRHELAGPPPAVGLIWIDGYWNWTDRRHAWVPGHWEAPRPGHHWVPRRWEQRGGQWALRGGYWSRD
ncbi:MAG: YXWGXW repeat-containing protein [Azonexus sp.]|nr:YXWGXW repeat-containing protein [Betaproteobacteria bacterium]MBK8916731.1 YXWGXW repeat-containing protein [Betaproteobacteria bacterium]MBP6036448.1 YXWGXW repeat-containing protein [Azonexus sp.]MBP6907057.1 YXWGXW repeat-containing protein [Azonexus sp.]